MGLLNNLALGFGVAFTFQNLLYAFFGCVLGTLIGVLPGIGPVATIAMLLPSIYALDATPALIMLAGIYYGAQYGGSTTAILINVPGESSSVVTAIDGYQLAKKGRAGATLTIVAVGSFIGGTLAVIGVMMFSSLLAAVAIPFGPPEFFALPAGGLLGMAHLSGGPPARARRPVAHGAPRARRGRLQFGIGRTRPPSRDQSREPRARLDRHTPAAPVVRCRQRAVRLRHAPCENLQSREGMSPWIDAESARISLRTEDAGRRPPRGL